VLYELLKCFRALDEAGTKEIRRLVQEGKIIETRDGKVLAIRTEKFETLSKKSVIEALGKVAGEKELKRLRAKGAIREATREKLVTEK
jgi:ribosomal protein L19E